MAGFVTTRDLVIHPAVILREFGLACYLRCLVRTLVCRRVVTFLECI